MSPWQQHFLIKHHLSHEFLAPALKVCELLATQIIGLVSQPIIAISGPQGSGKTTLADFLKFYLINELALRADTVSLDDYYLDKQSRQHLSQVLHPLFLTRGVPGTHNVSRGIRDFKDFKAGKPIGFPQFDKSMDNPTEDKAPEQLDVLIFEGWCVGAKAEPDERLSQPLNALERDEDVQGRFRRAVNQKLQGDYQTWFEYIDYLVFIEIESFDSIAQWRAQQEAQLIAKTGLGMTSLELQRFMEFFERLTRWSQSTLGLTCHLHLYMDSNHYMSIKK